MGTTIRYRGCLRDADAIDELVAEVSGVAETLGWTYHTVRDEALRGVVLEVHPDCDPVVLLVDRDGTLRLPFEAPGESSLQLCVRTGCAPAEVHMAIVRLFRHLEDRYFAKLIVDDDSGCWETEDRHGFIRHHPCASVLTDRLSALPAGMTRPPDDGILDDGIPDEGDVESLVERLEDALDAWKREERDRDHGGPFEGGPFEGEPFAADDLDDDPPAFVEPLPPDPGVLMAWDVGDWIDYFERHDRSRNSFLGFMSGREETEEEFSMARRRSEEEDARRERRAARATGELEREVVELRRRRAAGEEEEPDADESAGTEDAEDEFAEPWQASLPRFAGDSWLHGWRPEQGSPERSPNMWPADATDSDCAADGWTGIAAECPAFDDALDLMRELARRERGGVNESPMLGFVHGSISTTIIGVSMGYYHWSRSEGYPLARTARYVLASRTFAQIARLLERMGEPELRALAPRARSIASGFAGTAAESPGGRRWGR